MLWWITFTTEPEATIFTQQFATNFFEITVYVVDFPPKTLTVQLYHIAI